MRGAYSLFMTKTTKTERAPKGMPTDMNLSVLDQVFNLDGQPAYEVVNGRTVFNRTAFHTGGAGNVETPNGFICPTNVASVRRCLKFGLLTVSKDRRTLRLTEMGESALCAFAFEHGQRMAAREVLS